MSARTCAQVAEFVRRRSTGEISSDDFFASLANVHLEHDPVESLLELTDLRVATSHACSPQVNLSAHVPGEPSCLKTWLNLDEDTSMITSGTTWDVSTYGSNGLERAGKDVHHSSIATESEPTLADIPSLLTESEATTLAQHMRKASNASWLLPVDPPGSNAGSPGMVPGVESFLDQSNNDLADVGYALQQEAVPFTQSYGCTTEPPELPADLVGNFTEECLSSPRHTSSCSRSPCMFSESPLINDRATACLKSPCSRSFEMRNEFWASKRSTRLQHLRRQRAAKEVEECTFQPVLRGSMRRSASESMCESLSGLPVSQLRRSSHAAVQRWIEQREESLMKECTFTPDLRASTKSFQRNFDRLQTFENSMSSIDMSCRHKMPLTHEVAGGQHGTTSQRSSGTTTWTEPYVPQTNEVPTDMVHAREYLKNNVFERLAHTPVSPRSTPTKSITPSRKTVEMSSTDGSSNSTSISHGRPQEEFTAFLQRQRDYEKDRLSRIQGLENDMAPPLQPRLCPRSRAIVDQRQTHRGISIDVAEPIGSCQQSASEDMHHDSCAGECPKQYYIGELPQLSSAAKGFAASARTGSPSAKDIDPECSFHPEINATSARLPPKGATDLSIGEQQRRCIRAAERRERIRQAEPKIPSAPLLLAAPAHLQGTKGKLRVLEDAAGYTARIQQMRSQRNFHNELTRQQQAAEEMEECTFRPEINDELPAYVRDMADFSRSVKHLWGKQTQSALLENSKQRPDWQ